MKAKEQKEGNVRFVGTWCTQKSHMTWTWNELTKGIKSCNNHRIQEIILWNHAILSCTSTHSTTSHTTDMYVLYDLLNSIYHFGMFEQWLGRSDVCSEQTSIDIYHWITSVDYMWCNWLHTSTWWTRMPYYILPWSQQYLMNSEHKEWHMMTSSVSSAVIMCQHPCLLCGEFQSQHCDPIYCWWKFNLSILFH